MLFWPSMAGPSLEWPAAEANGVCRRKETAGETVLLEDLVIAFHLLDTDTVLELGVVSSPGLRCAVFPPPREFKNGLPANGKNSKVCLWSCGFQGAMLSLAVIERSETCSWVCRKELLKEMLLLSFLSCSGWNRHLQWWCYCCNLNLTGPSREGPEQLLCGTWKFWPRLVTAPGCTKLLGLKVEWNIQYKYTC